MHHRRIWKASLLGTFSAFRLSANRSASPFVLREFEPLNAELSVECRKLEPMISRSGQQLVVEGTSHGQPMSQLTKSVVVESDSGEFVPWQEDSLAGITCDSCTSEDSGGHLKCVRVPCPDDGLVGSERQPIVTTLRDMPLRLHDGLRRRARTLSPEPVTLSAHRDGATEAPKRSASKLRESAPRNRRTSSRSTCDGSSPASPFSRFRSPVHGYWQVPLVQAPRVQEFPLQHG
jgi:hypothetical protein